MSSSGAGFVAKNYPAIVRAGIDLVLDPPADVQVRVDPDGERKAEERRRRNTEWREQKLASGIPEIVPDLIRPLPKLKTIHLQWLDTSYVREGHEPVWRDAQLHVDLEKRRLYDMGGGIPFLSKGHQGSAAIGVMLFSSPVLLAISPYLMLRGRIYRARERKHGMSRHAVALLEKLKGQIDAETEALLGEAFRNEWTRHLKLDRHVSFREAGIALDACDLTERRSEPVEGDRLRKELLQDFLWFDDDGDMIGHAQLVDGQVHAMRVLGADFRFEEQQARALLERGRSRRVVSDDEE